MPENDIFYFHPDHLGSTSYITTRNGSISQHVEYIAFGEVLFEEHSSSYSSPYLFNGKELDRETNLSYYGARYLDMKASLWLNVDPLALYNPVFEDEFYFDGEHNGGVYNGRNLSYYGYCYQNPILFIDPNGKQSVSDVIHGGLDVIGLVPAFGEVADGINAVYYLAEGNHVDAALSAASMVPLAGYAAGAAKAARYAKKAEKAADAAKIVEKNADKVVDKVTDAVKAKKPHGNKLGDQPAEGYTLRDKKTGEVKKYGETTRGEDKFGKGKQKRYTKKELKEKDVYYQKETSGTKKEMHNWQHKKIKKYKSNNKEGNRPSLNKSDY